MIVKDICNDKKIIIIDERVKDIRTMLSKVKPIDKNSQLDDNELFNTIVINYKCRYNGNGELYERFIPFDHVYILYICDDGYIHNIRRLSRYLHSHSIRMSSVINYLLDMLAVLPEGPTFVF